MHIVDTKRGAAIPCAVLWACLASCHPSPHKTPPPVTALRTEPATSSFSTRCALIEKLDALAADERWEEYWHVFIQMCYSPPDGTVVEMPQLIVLVNTYPAWGLVQPFGIVQLPDARMAATLQALEHLAASAPPQQASEAYYVAALLIASTRDWEDSVPLFRELVSRFPGTAAAESAAREVWEFDHLRVGMKLPEVTWRAANRAVIGLRSLRGPSVLYFWFAGCGPCKGLIAELRTWAPTNPQIDIIGVNCDESADEFAAAVKAHSPPGTQVFMNDQDQSARFSISGYPRVLVISADAEIIARDPKVTDLSEILAAVPARSDSRAPSDKR